MGTEVSYVYAVPTASSTVAKYGCLYGRRSLLKIRMDLVVSAAVDICALEKTSWALRQTSVVGSRCNRPMVVGKMSAAAPLLHNADDDAEDWDPVLTNDDDRREPRKLRMTRYNLVSQNRRIWPPLLSCIYAFNWMLCYKPCNCRICWYVLLKCVTFCYSVH